eukprot:TRINITY_DN30340_c0_g1_i1.p1 TRINITY_DN30340_c0_g1~~TRINITY_DN30340_c0_g1_i1.p1  ORF type:complete len:250 (-),score=33.72 TRINITY_DN30340_c0_g1_i1:98-847(-)
MSIATPCQFRLSALLRLAQAPPMLLTVLALSVVQNFSPFLSRWLGGPRLAAAWPDYILHHDCEKGEALVALAQDVPIIIMNMIPEEVPGLMSVYRGGGADDGTDEPLPVGVSLPVGTPMILRYTGPLSLSHDTHIAFIVSSGSLPNSEPCGFGDARLVCSTCNKSRGFLRTVSWTPGPKTGPAVVTLSVAHTGPGTPSVRIDRLPVIIVPSEAGVPVQAPKKMENDSDTEDVVRARRAEDGDMENDEEL